MDTEKGRSSLPGGERIIAWVHPWRRIEDEGHESHATKRIGNPEARRCSPFLFVSFVRSIRQPLRCFYFGERRLRVEELASARVLPEAREAFTAARTAAPDSAEWHRAINRVCSFYEHLTAKNLIAAGATWPGLHTWDDRRTVDYLVSRPDVDPERIGCAGLSIGGLRTAHLIAADPRIKAASITGWMTEFAYQHRNHLRNHTWMIFIPGLYGSMDFPDIASLHAPGALLVQQCSQDRLYPLEAMQAAVNKLARIYQKAAIPERFRGTFHDEPHAFKPHMQDETFEWFDRWL